jgi:hypothetical protein
MTLAASIKRAITTATLSLSCTLVLAVSIAQAEEVIDLEDASPNLPGWAAYGPGPGNQREYRAAAKWDVPFTVTLDNEVFHSGSASLKCETSQDAAEMSPVPPTIPASGAVTIRFFIRTSGVDSQEGTFVVSQIDSSGKSGKGLSSEKIPPSDNAWVEVTWTGELNPETAGVRLLFTYKDLPAGARVWLDDISVKSAE